MTRTFRIRDGDVVIRNSSGRLDMVEDAEKARQSMDRLLALDEPQGAGLNRLIGSTVDDSYALSARIQRQVRAAFTRLVMAQRGNQLASRTDEERLSSIQRMYVSPINAGGGNSKTGYTFRVDALTVAGEQVPAGSTLLR